VLAKAVAPTVAHSNSKLTNRTPPCSNDATGIGMTDYLLDQVEGPQHHPAAVARLTKSCLSAVCKALRGEASYSLTA
jgi:hypothetical protein